MYSQNDALSQKAQTYITLMSAALGVAGAFKVFDREHDVVDLVLLSIMALAYATGVFIALRILSQKEWRYPVDIDNFKSKMPFTETEYFMFIFDTYVETMKFNQAIVTDKGNAITWATRFTVVVFVATLIIIAR